jgi:hypothetical protein
LVSSIFNPDRKHLNSWILYADPSTTDGEALIHAPETIAEFDKMAAFFGVTWRLHGRKGWERVLKGVCEPVRVTFERIVQ